MKVFCSQAHGGHAPRGEYGRGGLTPYPESPARVDAILRGLREAGLDALETPEPAPLEALAAVHPAEYLTFLQEAYPAWQRSGGQDELAAAVFAPRWGGRRPDDVLGQVGWYGFDTTPLVAGTWAAARAAAGCALAAAERIAAGDRAAYALCRPPGHHAGAAYFGGYCFLNNAALAAERLARQGPVAVVDIDYHHGNGTQDLFYASDRVFFASLHADPEWEYPLFWGRADETGAGDGAGCTLNAPLPPGTGDGEYLAALGQVLEAVRGFRPQYLVVSAGFDGFGGDPVGQFRLTAAGYRRIGAALAGLDRPAVVVQEGGYHLDALRTCVPALLSAFR